MIALFSRAVAQFFDNPIGSFADMRHAAPHWSVAVHALIAATLVLVVIDMAYGPLAFPHSVEPGGKRAFGAFTVAFVELARIFAIAAMIWMGARLVLRSRATAAEALWLTLPYAIALIGFELAQLASWLLALGTGINYYGQVFLIGFCATLLILVLAVRTLAPDRDWLACLPVAILAFFAGYFLAPAVLIVATWRLIRDRIHPSAGASR